MAFFHSCALGLLCFKTAHLPKVPCCAERKKSVVLFETAHLTGTREISACLVPLFLLTSSFAQGVEGKGEGFSWKFDLSNFTVWRREVAHGNLLLYDHLGRGGSLLLYHSDVCDLTLLAKKYV